MGLDVKLLFEIVKDRILTFYCIQTYPQNDKICAQLVIDVARKEINKIKHPCCLEYGMLSDQILG